MSEQGHGQVNVQEQFLKQFTSNDINPYKLTELPGHTIGQVLELLADPTKTAKMAFLVFVQEMYAQITLSKARPQAMVKLLKLMEGEGETARKAANDLLSAEIMPRDFGEWLRATLGGDAEGMESLRVLREKAEQLQGVFGRRGRGEPQPSAEKGDVSGKQDDVKGGA